MKSVLNLRVFLGAVLVALLLWGGTLAYLLWLQPMLDRFFLIPDASAGNTGPSQTGPGTGSAPAVLTIIPPPTSTPRYVVPTLTPTLATPLATATTPPLPGAFAIGVYVQISGTGGQGLHLRAQPGLGNAPLFLGYDAEVYLITDGPVQADGYTWWHLTAPYDQLRSGWAVEDYLSVIPKP